MQFKEIVEQHLGDFTEAEKRLIKEGLGNPQELVFLTAAELAMRARVHESTVVRLAQKLGFQGYRDLKQQLQEDLMDTVNSSERIRRRLERPDILASLVSDEIAALRELLGTVTQDQLDEVAKLLVAAERVFLFARGHATALLEYTDRRLRRSGFKTVDLRGRGRELAEQVLTLSEKDVLLAFAMRKKQPGLETLLEHAIKTNVPSIVISDSLGPLIRPKPTLLIWARRGAEGKFQSNSTSLTICSALILTIAVHDGGRTFKSLDGLASLIRRYEQVDM